MFLLVVMLVMRGRDMKLEIIDLVYTFVGGRFGPTSAPTIWVFSFLFITQFKIKNTSDT